MKELQTVYKEYKEALKAYELALNTMYYDLSTIAPKKGVEARNEAMTYLSGESFSIATDPASLEAIEELGRKSDDPLLKKEIQLLLKDLELNRKLPKEVFTAFDAIQFAGHSAWQEAIQANDYSIFKPHLINIIQKKKEVLSYLDKTCSNYDFLLDSFQQGMSIKTYDAFFEAIKTQLVPLIKEIQEKGKPIDASALFQPCSIEKQKAFHAQLLEYLHMDKEACIIGETQHPFTQFFSAHEARITTHFYEDNVMDSIFSTIHEYGHALYDLQITPEYDGTALKNSIGFAMHESQSRFLENHIGRSEALWEVQYPILQDYFPEQFKDISFSSFMKMINVSKPSLIRTKADELTYPLHILIRYELEKEIMDGNANVEQLDSLWNDKYEEYLGIRPSDDASGILQDMHWSGGDFGYFPTYALGSAFSAQFYHAMEKEIDIDEALRTSHFEYIQEWLQEHIHQYGAALSAEEIMLKATGEAFNPQYYITYLTTKYRKLYHI